MTFGDRSLMLGVCVGYRWQRSNLGTLAAPGLVVRVGIAPKQEFELPVWDAQQRNTLIIPALLAMV